MLESDSPTRALVGEAAGAGARAPPKRAFILGNRGEGELFADEIATRLVLIIPGPCGNFLGAPATCSSRNTNK
jgi:hypothetical protein